MLKYSLKRDPPLSTLRDCKTTRLKFGIGSLNMFNLLYKEFKTNKQLIQNWVGWKHFPHILGGGAKENSDFVFLDSYLYLSFR